MNVNKNMTQKKVVKSTAIGTREEEEKEEGRDAR